MRPTQMSVLWTLDVLFVQEKPKAVKDGGQAEGERGRWRVSVAVKAPHAEGDTSGQCRAEGAGAAGEAPPCGRTLAA